MKNNKETIWRENMSNLSSNELEQVRLKSNKEIDKISYVYYSDLYADERFKVLNKKII